MQKKWSDNSLHTVTLCLPNRITNTPGCCKHEEKHGTFVRDPDEKAYHECNVHNDTKPQHHLARQSMWHQCYHHSSNHIGCSQCDHAIPNVVHPKATCHIVLKQNHYSINSQNNNWAKPKLLLTRLKLYFFVKASHFYLANTVFPTKLVKIFVYILKEIWTINTIIFYYNIAIIFEVEIKLALS